MIIPVLFISLRLSGFLYFLVCLSIFNDERQAIFFFVLGLFDNLYVVFGFFSNSLIYT